ncbi:MAG TPA: AsmA-like C-terminal domain-containing protein [Stellaceae bacterium]
MVRRSARLLLRCLAGLAAGLVLLVAFVVWRLATGPLSLDFLAPYLADAIVGARPELVVRIDHTLVSIEKGGTIEVIERGVHLGRRDGEAQLTLPEVSVAFSLRAALTGVIAPTRIILRQPELRIDRGEDGTFRLGIGGGGAAGGDWAGDLLRDLAAPPNQQDSLGYLTQVAVRNAALTVDDRALGVTWRAKRADATLFRGEGGVFGDLALAVEQPGGGETELRSDFRYPRGGDRLAMQLGFDDLRPALFSGAAPTLAPLAAVDLPLSGQFRLELDVAGARISDAWCDLTLGPGRIVHPALQGGGVTVASGQLRADYDPAAGRLTLQRLHLDLGGPQVDATGTVDGLGDGILAGGLPVAMDIATELQLSEVPIDRLPDLWPERLAAKARSWVVEHIHDGVAGATGQIGAHVDLTPNAARPVRLDAFAGTLHYRGLTVEYFKPLPPLHGVDGMASFDRASLELKPSAGAVKQLQVTGGTAKLSKLDTNDEQIAMDLALRGPLRDVLELLDSEPLHFVRDFKIEPAKVAGQVDGRVLFDFPLKHDLKVEEIGYGARATLAGVSIAEVLAGHDLADGEFRLQLDRAALRLDGTARLADVPATLSWLQSLKRSDAIRARYAVKARLDDAARRRLDLDFLPEMVKGPVDVDLAYALGASKRATADVTLGLKDAALEVARLNWRKPPGVPATATLALDVVDERIRAIREATIKGGGADARLSATFGPAGDLAAAVTRVDVPRLILAETDASGSLARRGQGGWQVELRGMSFDATGLMAEVNHASAGTGARPPLTVDVALDRLILGPKREAREVKGQLYDDGVHWQAATLDAAMFGGGKASLRFGEAGGARNFHLSTDNFGELLRLLGVSDNVRDGQLEVSGQAQDKGLRRVFRGTVDGSDYRLVNAPLFARLLSVASFSGIGGLLTGEGIPFTRLKADFTVADGKVEVTDGRAYGGAIGVNAGGSFDTTNNTLDIAGTLVPAYTLNSVLGNIPVLGNLLLGGEGEGIFAANFRIAGPVSDPKITVNPLSTLAPGVLRKLFLFEAPEPAVPAPKPDAGPAK